MNQTIEQYSLYWVDLNPTKGSAGGSCNTQCEMHY